MRNNDKEMQHKFAVNKIISGAILVILVVGYILHIPIVKAAPVLALNKASLDFTGNYSRVVGLYAPMALSVTVSNGGDGALNWSMAGSNNETSRYLEVLSKTGTATCTGGGGTNISCTGGQGTVTLNLRFTSWWNKLNTPGTYTTTLTFTNTDTSETVQLPVTLSVVSRSITPEFVYNSGFPVGCSNSNATWFGAVKDTCVIPDERPSSLSFNIPAVGDSYTDPNFGNTVRTLTGPRNVHSYASLGAFNSDGTLVAVRSLAGGDGTRVVNTQTAATVASSVPGRDIWQMWSSTNPNVYYYFTGQDLYSYTVGGSSTFIRNFQNELGVGNNPTSGGQGDLSKDDWISFHNWAARTLCAYDIPNDEVYCGSFASTTPALESMNYAMISKGVDSQSGKRYVIAGGHPASVVFSVNAVQGRLDMEYTMPNFLGYSSTPIIDWNPDNGCVIEGSQICYNNGHDDTVEDENGVQYVVRGIYLGSPNAQGMAAYQLNKGKLMTLPVELGGGWHQIYWYQPGSGVSAAMTMNHVGCARRAPYCVITTGRKGHGGVGQGGSLGHRITGATNEANIKITTQTAHGYSAGNMVNIGGVAGNTAANGIWTVQSVIDTYNFTINSDGRNSGAYESNYGGTVGRGEALGGGNTFQGEVIVFKVGGTTPDIHRVAMHRTVYYSTEDGTNFGYWAIARGSISQDASKVVYDSNFGEPTQMRVMLAETGLGDVSAPSDTTAPTISSVAESGVTQSTATITWTTNEASDTQVLYGTTSSLGSASAIANTSSRVTSHSVSLSGLAAGTTYHYRARSSDAAGNASVSSIATFTTTAASSGGGGSSPAPKQPHKFKVTASTLEGYSSIAAYPTATVEVINQSTRAVLSTQSLTADSTGVYTVTFSSADPDTVGLRVKISGFLPRVLPNISTITDTTATPTTVPTLPAGDFNGDGIINSLDYSSLNRKWNQTASIQSLDINRDGVVNSLDYVILSRNWGVRGE